MDSQLNIGIIGDFQRERPSHVSTNDSIDHCANYLGVKVKVEWLPTESLETCASGSLRNFDGLWCAPGEYTSMKGALIAIQYARENNVPFIGTCQGFQHMVIEYGRNKLGLKDVQHAEFNPSAPDQIITALSCSFIGENRMVYIKHDSRIFTYYRTEKAIERFTCNFGINPYYRELLDRSGFKIVGTDENSEVRILELCDNTFYIGTLFQPQLCSKPENPHKLILAFLSYSQQFHRNNR